MFRFAIPCIVNIASWCILIVDPMLGFREDLETPFVAILLVGYAAAFCGIIVAIRTTKGTKTIAYLCFFVAVVLLNMIGGFVSAGMAAAALS